MQVDQLLLRYEIGHQGTTYLASDNGDYRLVEVLSILFRGDLFDIVTHGSVGQRNKTGARGNSLCSSSRLTRKQKGVIHNVQISCPRPYRVEKHPAVLEEDRAANGDWLLRPQSPAGFSISICPPRKRRSVVIITIPVLTPLYPITTSVTQKAVPISK